MTTLQDAARIALSCLDLTSLNDADAEVDVVRLCARARTAHGKVAAVCVWPRFAALARRELPPGIGVAAVANFPDGGVDLDRVLREAGTIADAGAQEVDVVLPFAAMREGDEPSVERLLRTVRRASDGLTLKVILETGVLADEALIARASVLALDAGADFLKTSTGRAPVGATPEAVLTMLAAITAAPTAATRVGLKISGGIRTVAEAASYMALVRAALGAQALEPRRFRIGASGLLSDVERVLGDGRPTADSPGSDASY